MTAEEQDPAPFFLSFTEFPEKEVFLESGVTTRHMTLMTYR